MEMFQLKLFFFHCIFHSLNFKQEQFWLNGLLYYFLYRVNNVIILVVKQMNQLFVYMVNSIHVFDVPENRAENVSRDFFKNY
jgi:hypothetical protein